VHPCKLRELDPVLVSQDLDGRWRYLWYVLGATEDVPTPLLLQVLVRPLLNRDEPTQHAKNRLLNGPNIYKRSDQILELRPFWKV
jgi:hypothetical protein